MISLRIRKKNGGIFLDAAVNVRGILTGRTWENDYQAAIGVGMWVMIVTVDDPIVVLVKGDMKFFSCFEIGLASR